MSLLLGCLFMLILCQIHYCCGQQNPQNLAHGGNEVGNNTSHSSILETDSPNNDTTEASNEIIFSYAVNETDLLLNASNINKTSLNNGTEEEEAEDYPYDVKNDSLTTSMPDVTSESTVPPSTETQGRNLDSETTVEDFCLCDLKVEACDINCCCDDDCSEEDRKVFSHCQQRQQPVLDPEYCFQELLIFSNHTEYLVEYIHPGALCIVTDNLPERTTYTLVKGATDMDEYESLAKKRHYYSWMPDLDSKPSSFEPYKDGALIWALDKDGYIFPVGIPVAVVGNECESTTSVLYLQDVDSSCHQVLEDLLEECESNPYLNARLYVTLSVIADPRSIYQNHSTQTTTEAAVDEVTTAKSDSDTSNNTTSKQGSLVRTNDTTEDQKSDLKMSTLKSAKTESEGTQKKMNSVSKISVDLHDLWNKYEGQLVPMKTFICQLETNKELCVEMNNDTFPKPVYDSGICRNVLSSIMYNFIHNGTDGIYELQAKVYLTNLSDTVLHINQKFTAKFSWTSLEERTTFERSGRPGYITGKPLLMGSIVQNRTEEDVMKEAISLSTNPRNWMTILSPGSSGRCDSASEVTFGLDVRANCRFMVQQEDFAQDCEVLQERILRLLLGPFPLNDKNVRIASYGDSSVTNPADWVPILVPEEPQCGISSKLLGANTHYNLITSIHIEIAFSLQGSLANPQAKVVGVSLRYGEPHEIRLPCSVTGCMSASNTAGFDLEIISSVSFVDVTRPPLPAYAKPPAVDVKLPYDFFYPFLPSSSSCYQVNCFLVCAILLIMCSI